MTTRKYILTSLLALLFVTAGIIAQDIPPAPDLYEQAMEAKEAKNWNKASDLLQEYVDNYKNEQRYYDALYWLGISYQRSESDYPKAFSIRRSSHLCSQPLPLKDFQYCISDLSQSIPFQPRHQS